MYPLIKHIFAKELNSQSYERGVLKQKLTFAGMSPVHSL